MNEYRSTFSMRLLEDGTTFRITYWRPDIPAVRLLTGAASTREMHPGFTPPMARHRGRTVCPVSGKLRYGTRLVAERAIAAGVVSGNRHRREVRVYWCSDCNAFHLTSKP